MHGGIVRWLSRLDYHIQSAFIMLLVIETGDFIVGRRCMRQSISDYIGAC